MCVYNTYYFISFAFSNYPETFLNSHILGYRENFNIFLENAGDHIARKG